MRQSSSRMWRIWFVVGGLLYLGGLQHPHGALVDMLPDPAWIRAHVTILAGLVVLVAGLVSFRRSVEVSLRLRRWVGFAIVMTAFEVLEMAVHTFAFVDADALASGAATPVLTTHLGMATAIYTPYAISMIGLIWLGQREGALGSPWIGWIGLFGAAAHGVVMWLVFVFEVSGSGILFPLSVSLAIWFILAGVWPAGSLQPAGAAETASRVGARRGA